MIQHEFIAIDEGHATLLRVDELDPSQNWLVPVGHHGYTEFDLALGRVVKEFKALAGVTV